MLMSCSNCEPQQPKVLMNHELQAVELFTASYLSPASPTLASGGLHHIIAVGCMAIAQEFKTAGPGTAIPQPCGNRVCCACAFAFWGWFAGPVLLEPSAVFSVTYVHILHTDLQRGPWVQRGGSMRPASQRVVRATCCVFGGFSGVGSRCFAVAAATRDSLGAPSSCGQKGQGAGGSWGTPTYVPDSGDRVEPCVMRGTLVVRRAQSGHWRRQIGRVGSCRKPGERGSSHSSRDDKILTGQKLVCRAIPCLSPCGPAVVCGRGAGVPPPLYKLRQSPQLIRSLRLL